MKSRVMTCIIAMTVFAALVTPIQLAAQDQQEHHKKQTHYIVKDLGTLGGTFADAEGLDNKGWSVGESRLAGDIVIHAALWRDGELIDLGTLGGLNSVNAPFPTSNDRGLIVGPAETSAVDPFAENFCGLPFTTGLMCRGFLWMDGVMTALPTLGGNNGEAATANNGGQVVGTAETSVYNSSCVPPQVFDFEPVIWGREEKGDDGEFHIHQLPLLSGDTDGIATGINDLGQVVGVSGSCTALSSVGRAVIWQHDIATDMGDLGGTLYNLPLAINNRGQVVGVSSLPGDTTFSTFLWQAGVMADLGMLPGDASSVAFGINNHGQVVGTSCSGILATGNCRAYIWQDGAMTDLNTLVKSASTSFPLLFANQINDRGEIAGIAALAYDPTQGEGRAFLAIPCDETHASYEGCADSTAGPAAAAQAVSERPRVILPEGVRGQLQKRRGLGRFAGGPVTPQ